MVLDNVSLKPYNTFGIEAYARLFTIIDSTDKLRTIISDPKFNKEEKLLLGGGSNILLTGDFDGLVIKNGLKGIHIEKEDSEHVWVKACAGEVWHELVLFCIEKNLAGIENLSLIPGCCGAAPMQNIGAYGVELKDVFEGLEALDMQSGEMIYFSNADCRFGYRESIFKNECKGKYMITSITLRLNKTPHFNISYGDIKKTLYEDMMVNELTVKAVSDAVIKIRKSKLPDPAELGNAGSFFKNPEIPLSQYENLKENHPLMPGYPMADPSKVKVAAGWLIEQCGWKGKRVGNTGSHARQALVLVNYGNTTGAEVKSLAFEIIDSVKKRFGIELKPEVNFTT